MKHKQPSTGLWTTSNNKETWPAECFFDTEQEAIEHAKAVGHSWIGRAFPLTADEVALAFLRNHDEADEYLSMQDEWEWCDDDLIRHPGSVAFDEIVGLLREWVIRHDLVVPHFLVKGARDVDIGETT